MRLRTYQVLSFTFIWIGFGIFLWSYGLFPSFAKEPVAGKPVSQEESSVSEQEEIPDQAIRLRILANSDSAQDQWIKRLVRNAIVEELKTWSTKPASLEEARQMIREHKALFEKIARQTLDQHGFDYEVKVDFGVVPFPTKLYGNKVYSAGDYEALLITLGKGNGDNWWCVLFPPLCFVDMGNGNAIPKEEVLSASISSDHMLVQQPAQDQPKQVEVKFLLQEKWQEIWNQE